MFDDLAGKTIGQYILLQKEAETPLGVSFWARSVDLTREVSLSIIKPELAAGRGFPDAFNQLAGSAEKLNHPGLVKVYEHGQSQDVQDLFYFVSEWLPGKSLRGLIDMMRERGTWFSLGEAVRLVRQLAIAFNYVRAAGEERILNPERVKIKLIPIERLPYSPVIDDAGLDALLGEASDRRLQLTPAYISPELALNEATDARSDVYSLGVLLYELVTGQLPFPVTNLESAARFHSKQPLTPPDALRPDLPPPLSQAIVHALQKDPHERFQTAGEMAEELNWILPALDGMVAPPPAYEHTESLMGFFLVSLGVHRAYAESMAATRSTPTPPISPRTQPIQDTVPLMNNQEKIEVTVDPSQLSIEPGGSVTANIAVYNNTKAEGYFVVGIQGISSSWLTLSPREFPLKAGEQKSIQLVIRPPRTITTRAGRYPLTIRAVNSQKIAQVGEARVNLTIGAFNAFSGELRTPEIKSDEFGSLAITNGGNVTDTYTITCKDASDELNFEPAQSQVRLNPGQVGQAEFQASLRTPRLFGGLRDHSYIAEVASASGDKQELTGSFISKAILPTWVPIIFLILCLCITSIAVFSTTSSILRGNAIERTQIAQDTGTVLSAQNTIVAATQTAIFLENANQATIQSVTQTVQMSEFQTATMQVFGTTTSIAATATSLVFQATAEANATAAYQFTQTAFAQSTIQAGLSGTATAISATATSQTGMILTETAKVAQTATAQAGFNQTATVQAGFNQTATAQAGFFQTATSIAATLTAQAPVPTTPVPPTSQVRPLLYLYLNNQNLGNEYKQVLGNYNFNVDVRPIDVLPSINLQNYRAILVGPDTGKDGSWGDIQGSWANILKNSNLPIVGLGEGGFDLFGKLNLLIGFPNGISMAVKDVAAFNTSSPVWSTPNPISIPGSGIVPIYSIETENFATIIQQSFPINVFAYGQWPKGIDQFPITRQDLRYVMWGFKNSPNNLTNEGRSLFLNILEDLLKP